MFSSETAEFTPKPHFGGVEKYFHLQGADLCICIQRCLFFYSKICCIHDSFSHTWKKSVLNASCWTVCFVSVKQKHAYDFCVTCMWQMSHWHTVVMTQKCHMDIWLSHDVCVTYFPSRPSVALSHKWAQRGTQVGHYEPARDWADPGFMYAFFFCTGTFKVLLGPKARPLDLYGPHLVFMLWKRHC